MDRKMWLVTLTTPMWGGCIETGIGGPRAQSGPLGNPAELENTIVVDEVLQVTTPKADILWMIDNSCSMGDEQGDLTENFPFFMDYFLGSGLDYHIAITTSDTISSNYAGADGTFVRGPGGITVIDSDTPDQVATFSAMAKVGTGGRFPERGIGAVFLALEEKIDGPNAGFWRDDAALHTICISDEADYTEDNVVTLPEFIDWYDGQKDQLSQRTFSAITAQRGGRYRDVAREIGGVDWDLAEENWPGLLEQLGLQASGFDTEYFLTQAPIDATIVVQIVTPEGAVQNYDRDVDWVYNPQRNSITFLDFIPQELHTIRITYELLSADQVQNGVDVGDN